MPTNQARNETVMNSPIFTRVTGTPTARALAALPPTARIQFPILVRCRTQAANRTKAIQYSTVHQTVTLPIVKLDAKIEWSVPKPFTPLMSGLDTEPVTTLVRP